MGKKSKKKAVEKKPTAAVPLIPWWFHPATGNYLTIAAAVALQFVVILLPLVGPAGAIAPHARLNLVAWHGALFLAMALSILALLSKLKRREMDGSRLPVWSMILVVATVFLLIAQAGGLLRI